MSKKSKKEIVFGVNNRNDFSLDYYDDGSVIVSRYKTGEIVTEFNEEMVALFMAILERDGHLKRLLEVDKARIKKLGFDKIAEYHRP